MSWSPSHLVVWRSRRSAWLPLLLGLLLVRAGICQSASPARPPRRRPLQGVPGLRRGRAPADAFPLPGAAAAMRTLPRDVASFTGRRHELAQLAAATDTGGAVGIHAIDGMAGVGKTRLG
jgi:hypothetical protein